MTTARTIHIVVTGLFFFLAITVSTAALAADAVEDAEQALEGADFGKLVPILESTVEAGDSERIGRAHLLFALGLFYEARTDGEDGDDEFVEHADHHIKEALREQPDIEVDPMTYPPRFITRVEKHREATSSTAETDGGDGPQIFYFERHVEHRSRLPLYLPGGVGQFYNGATFRGITFASIQFLGLATNALGYWMVESMRTSSGQISSQDIDRATGWQRAQFAGIGLLLSGWLLSSIEAHFDFEPEIVRIRTLDGPPQELETFPDAALGPDLSLGLEWRARF